MFYYCHLGGRKIISRRSIKKFAEWEASSLGKYEALEKRLLSEDASDGGVRAGSGGGVFLKGPWAEVWRREGSAWVGVVWLRGVVT